MFWETVKKEMTITRVLLAVVAILLCCFLCFGLPQKSNNQANEEERVMLDEIRQYLKQNESSSNTSPAHSEGIDTTGAAVSNTKTKLRPQDNIQIDPIPPNSQEIDNSGYITPPDQNTNMTNNGSEPSLDLVVEIDIEQEPESQPESQDLGVIEIDNQDSITVDELSYNNVVFSKTVRINRVEEVFEDLIAQNIRRIIKEDRVERVEVSKNDKTETIGNDLNIKNLLSL